MGLVAGLIAAPCTGPVLAVILTLVAREGDLYRGAWLMLFYGLGMGFPFLILGTFSSVLSRLPRSGSWMTLIKNIFGLAMLSFGLYYFGLAFPALERIFDQFGAWSQKLGLMALLLGLALGALTFSFHNARPWRSSFQFLGIILVAIGSNMLATRGPVPQIYAAPGDVSSWQEVAAQSGAEQQFKDLLKQAEHDCRPTIIDFSARWCASCTTMDQQTYEDMTIKSELARFARIKVDVTVDTDELRALQHRFGVVGLPTAIFLDSHGRFKEKMSVNGFVPPERFIKTLQLIH